VFKTVESCLKQYNYFLPKNRDLCIKYLKDNMEGATVFVLKTFIQTILKPIKDGLLRNKTIVQFLNELELVKPSDEFESVYLFTIIEYAKKGKEDELVMIFSENDVKNIFKTLFNEDFNDLGVLQRELDHQLHTSINIKLLKDCDRFPESEINEFIKLFKNEVRGLLSPTEIYLNNQYNNGTRETKGLLLDNGRSISSENLNREFKAQLEEIKSDINNNNISSPKNRLISLRERSWNNFNDSTKYFILIYLGNCSLKQKMQDDGAKYFIQALQFNPTSIEAIGYAISGYLYLGMKDDALRVYENIKNDPSIKAFTLKLLLEPFNYSEVLNKYKELNENDKKESDILYIITSLFFNHGRLPEALDFCEKLIDNFPSRIAYKEFYSQISYYYYGNENHVTVMHVNFSETKPILEKSLIYVEECLDYFLLTDLKEFKYDLLEYKSMFLHLLHDDTGALRVIDEALKIKNNDTYLLKNKALYLSCTKEYSKAIEILNSIEDKLHEKDSITTQLALCYFCNNEQDKAIKILEENFNKVNIEDKAHLNISLLLIKIYEACINDNIQNESEIVIDKIIKIYPANYVVLSYVSGLYYSKGNLIKSDSSILEAFEIFFKENNDSSEKNWFILVLELKRQNKRKEAISIYEKYTDVTIDNDFTYDLVSLYIEAGQREKALNIFSTLRLKYGVIKRFTYNEICVIIQNNDNDKAYEISKEYLKKINDIRVRNFVNGIDINKGHFKEVDSFLNSELDFLNINLDELKIVLDHMIAREMYEKALYISYEASRRFKSYQYNDFYIKVSLRINEFSISKTYLNLVEAKNDTIVFISNGNENFKYILEDRLADELMDNELNSENPLYYKLLNKKRGEVIKISEDGNNYTIENIEHKYVFKFHESIILASTKYNGFSSYQEKKLETIL
jgi:hypothetical protein